MKTKYKGFTLIEITLVIVLISILIAITTPLVSNVIARNDVGSAHESLYNALLRAQQLSKNQYQGSQWRLCLDNTNKQYTITSGTCSDPTNAEIIKISSNITISSEQTLDILFKAISGELDSAFNSIDITLSGGGASKSIKINPSGVIDKEANTTSVSTTTTPSIVTNGLVLNLDAGNINSYPGLNGTGNTWFDLSGNNNNGTLLNGVGYTSANGGSLVFDGVNDYVNGVHNIQTNITGDITIECWFRVNNPRSDWVRIFGKGDATNRTVGLWYNQTSSVFLYQRYGSTNMNAQYSSAVSLNTWFHMLGTSQSNNHILYLNSVQRATSSSGNIFSSSTDPYKVGYGNVHAYHIGNVSNCKVYNRALTPEEVQQNFNATKGRFGL